MIIDKVRVKNFRCLRETYTPLSSFSTIIGENNSGKSSLLEALIIFIKGTKLNPPDFYDPDEDIVIEIRFTSVTDESLSHLAQEHRERISELVRDQTLTLIRRYTPDGSSNLKCIRALPEEERFRPEYLSSVFSGLKGGQIREKLGEVYPEVFDQLDHLTQTRAKEIVQGYIEALPAENLSDQECDLPTGFDNSVRNLFPEPVYIPAVKDLTDEIKTKETTSFGRLLSILLNVIESQLIEEEDTFSSLNEKLNRLVTPDGVWEDNRLEEVKVIEQTIEAYVQENFPSTKINIQIPPPEIKTVLSSAKIMVNDGVEGLVDTKGDGLQRAVTFAILRTYVTLAAKPEWQKENARSVTKDRYLFLFEEPELYLHPIAQKILFNALKQISNGHQIIISTHSPLFLSPETIGAFIKMIKRDRENNDPPCSIALPIDLSDLSFRDQFQLICYENNNAAFFSDRVVFVEGDSDHICLRHIAKLLNADWDFSYGKVSIVKVNGKGSIARYREFFEKFGVKTYVISDLDVIIRDFDKLGLGEDMDRQRQAILRQVDEIIQREDVEINPNTDRVKKIVSRVGWKERWTAAKQMIREISNGKQVTQEDIDMLDTLFEGELEEPRLGVLKNHADIQQGKLKFLSSAYDQGVFILSNGSIEDYYLPEVTGPDKPSRAQDYCRKITTGEQVYKTCTLFFDNGAGDKHSEFDEFFARIFEGIYLK